MKKFKPYIIEGSNSCDKWDWDNLTWEVGDALLRLNNHTRNASNYYLIQGWNMGWRNLEGVATWYDKFLEKERTKAGQDFLFNILPRTDWNFKMKIYKSKITMTVYHHDSPTGEKYEIRCLSNNKYEKLNESKPEIF